MLDVGAGLGTSTLAVAWVATTSGHRAGVEVRAVDADAAALAFYRALVARAEAIGCAPVTARAEVLDARAADRVIGPTGDAAMRFDLIVVGLALNELFPPAPEGTGASKARADEAADWLTALSSALVPGGAIVVVEPALRPVARALHAARDALVERGCAPFVFAPCLGAPRCPMLRNARDWCHVDVPLRLPEPLAAIARAAGLREERLTYSYLTLRNEPGDASSALHRTEARAHAVRHRLVSAALGSKGKTERFGCGTDGLVRLTRLDRHASESNAPFSSLERGALACFEGLELRGDGARVLASTRVARSADAPDES